MTLLDDLVKNNNTVTTRLQDIYNLINAKIPQLSYTVYDWESQFQQTGKKTPAPRLTLKRHNETTVKTEHDELDDEDDDVPSSEVTYFKSKAGNNTLNTQNYINNGLNPNKSSSSNNISSIHKSLNNVRKDINNELVNSVINNAQQYYNINPNINNANIQSNTGSQETSKNISNHEYDSIVSASPSTTRKNKSISFFVVV